MSIKFLVLGGGIWGWGGGGSADFIFMGARIFLIKVKAKEIHGRPASRPQFVLSGVLGLPGRCPEDSSYVDVPFSFLI